MKKWFLFLVAIAAIHANAADYAYKYLVFTGIDGKKMSVSTDGLKLTLGDGNIVVSNNDGSATLQLSSITKMQFMQTDENTSTAIKQTVGDVQEGQVQVYNLSGMHKGTFNSIDEMKSRIGTGVYVIKQNGKKTKMIVK